MAFITARPLLREIAAAGIASLTTTAAWAQSALPPRDRVQAPTTGTAVIKGRVVDAQTGVGVARARVRLQGPGDRPPVLTDETGAFRLTDAPAGAFYLGIDRGGYMPVRFPEAGRTVRGVAKPLAAVDGETLDAGVVRLYRGGAIAGRIVDSHGEPAEFVQVQVLRLPPSGHGKPQPRGGGSTNDLGEFRLPRLEAGRYLLRAQARNLSPDDPNETQPVPTYYPGVLSMDEAQPIAIEREQLATAVEFMLLEGVSSIVSGTVVDARGQPLSNGVYLNARMLNATPEGMMLGTGVRPDGTFRMKLAPGEYQLEVQAARQGTTGPPSPDDVQFGRLRISVNGAPLSGLMVAMGAGATMTGKLVFEGESALPANLDQITVGAGPLPTGGNCQSGRGVTLADGTFRVQGIIGTCTVRAMGNMGRWAVKSVTGDDVDLIDRPVIFDPGQQLSNVRVVLTDRRTELVLQVTDDHGLSTREYVAMVFSQDRTKWNEMSRFVRMYLPPALVAMSPSRGTTGGAAIAPARVERPDAVTGLPPGDYYVVAVDDLPADGARDADVLQALVGGAVRVSLTDAAPVNISLRRHTLGR